MKTLLFFTLLLTSASVLSNPVINERELTYPIYGRSGQELRSQMDHRGPRGDAQFNASTRWYVQWRYQFDEEHGVCQITHATILVNVVYDLPEWKNYQAGEWGLQKKWDLTLHQLRVHEHAHGKNGINAGIAIEKALLKIPVMASCKQLHAEIDKKANSIIQSYHQKDIDLDIRTHHGVIS